MSKTLLILIAILFALMTAVGGKQGLKSFLSIFYNAMILLFMVYFIAWGFSPLAVTFIASVAITMILLFHVNGMNIKTKMSCGATIIALIFTFLVAFPLVSRAKIQGFNIEQLESLAFASFHIPISFATIIYCELIIGLLGAVVDVAISIATAMNELVFHEPTISRKALYQSGIKIGQDILGTMTNTLFFAYIGGFFALLIWFSVLDYSLVDILNSKIFSAELFQILIGGIGIALVIPITTGIMALKK